MRCVVVILAVCLAALPLAPTASLATDPTISDHIQETERQKKTTRPAPKDANQTEAASGGGQENKVMAASEQAHPAEPVEEEGLSTMSKVGIGVGVAAVVGVGLALAGGGGSDGDSGPTLPTAEMLVGKWNAQARCNVDSRTYTGVYDFYVIGSHTYDIFVTGDNARKQGRGNWTVIEGTNTLRVENDSGSIYVGEFQNENFTTITLSNQGNRWELVLTKQ